MITGRELALFEHRMARIDAHERSLGQPRQLLNVTPKSLTSPGWLFNRPDLDEPSPSSGLRQPYAQSPWVQRAIQLKAGEISAAPVKFYSGDREFTSPEIEAYWAAPFIGYQRQRLSMAEGQLRLVGWLDLKGKFFILRGDDWLVPFPEMKGGKLSPLVIANPDRMRAVMVKGELVGWEFTDGSGRRWELLPEQVDCTMLWNPYDEKQALAPVESILLAAESDFLAGLYVRNLMRNNGDQGVFVIGKGGIVDDTQREQIVEQLRAKRRAQLRGEFRPVFLTGDIVVEDAKAQVPEAGMNATRLLDRHTVFIGLGVPASMADVQASYSIGSDSDRARLITGTCQPLAKLINAPLGRIAGSMFGQTLTAESDWDEHPVMQAIRRERITSAKDLWDRGMSWKDINDFLDLGMQPFPGWDTAYLPFSVAPAGEAAPEPEPAKDTSMAEQNDDESPAEKQVRLAFLARRRAQQRACRKVDDEFEGFACGCGGVEHVGRALSPRQLAQWRTLMSKRRGTVKAFESAFTRLLLVARAEVLRKLAAGYTPKAAGAVVGKAGVAGDFLFDLAKFTADFARAMGNQHKTALKTAGQQLFDEISKDDPFSYPPDKALQFIRERENKLRGVPEEVFERVRTVLQDGINSGETADELAGRVKAEFDDMSDARARTIGLTETGAAYGSAREEAMKQAGVQWKQWLTSGNDNVRATHAEANDQIVRVTEPFVVAGEALMFPGDSSMGASAGNTINCHCVSVASPEGPEE